MTHNEMRRLAVRAKSIAHAPDAAHAPLAMLIEDVYQGRGWGGWAEWASPHLAEAVLQLLDEVAELRDLRRR